VHCDKNISSCEKCQIQQLTTNDKKQIFYASQIFK